jgi:hypothetical protein
MAMIIPDKWSVFVISPSFALLNRERIACVLFSYWISINVPFFEEITNQNPPSVMLTPD